MIPNTTPVPLIFSKPSSNLSILPNSPGIYITGLCIGGKFHPLYVGESQNLSTRGIRDYLNKHELFDFTNMQDVYDDLKLWNSNWHYPKGRPRGANASHIINLIKKNNNTLLWINGNQYFLVNFGLNLSTNSHSQVVRILPHVPLSSSQFNNWKQAFFRAMGFLNNNFAFSYVVLNGRRKQAETDTKYALDRLKIYTHSKANKYYFGGSPSGQYTIQLNFTC